MLNQNWQRWIFASLCKHFDNNKQTLSLFIEGQHRNIEGDFAELRILGPNFTEVSKKYWYITVTVNILIQTVINETDFHKQSKDIGIISAAFTNVDVYKYGYDDTLLGCLELLDAITVNNFGQIDPAVKLLQATVEGTYQMDLKE